MSHDAGISVRKAAMINAAGKYLKVLLTLLVNAVLARLLTPYDFGIVAVITVFTTFFSTLSDMGLGPAIIQHKDLDKNDIHSLFTYSLYLSLGLSLIFILCAWPIAWFYKDAVYLKPTMLLSLSLFFNAVNMVPNGMLNRDKKFVTIALRTVTVYILSAAVAIVLALNGWRFYALVVQAILASMLQFVWNWLSTRPSIVARPSAAALGRIKKYSFYQFAFTLVNYFARNLDNLLAGKFMGEVKLGNYNKAYNLMLFPVNNLSGVVAPVLHPILSHYQNDPTVIYQKYLRLVRLLFELGIFASSFAFLCSAEIIGILYGPQWEPCVRCFELLSIAILPQMINASAGAIFQSIGNTRLLFLSTCINTGLTLVAIILGVSGLSFAGLADIELLALCVALSYVLHFFVAFYILLSRGFGFSFTRFLGQLIPQWALLGLMLCSIMLYPMLDSALGLSGFAAESGQRHFILTHIVNMGFKTIYLALIFAAGWYCTRLAARHQ